jgi:hypothetical protein
VTDQQISSFRQTEELYNTVYGLVERALSERNYNPDDFRRAMDRILSQGKIEGRRGALKEEFRVPVAGEIWRDKTAHDHLIEITYVIPDGAVTYRSGEFAGHHVSLFGFWGDYEPTTPPNDQLIEGWQRIVDGGIS